MKDLKVYVDVFGHVSFMEKFPDDEEHAGLNEMLKEMVEQGDDNGTVFPGFYMAEMDIETIPSYSWDGPYDDAYMIIKELKPIKPNGIELTDTYINDCKEIDPSLKSIKILMKGNFNREITREF